MLTGSTYLLFWVENNNRLDPVVQQVGPTIGSKRPLLPKRPADPDDAMQFRPRRRSTAIAWSSRGARGTR